MEYEIKYVSAKEEMAPATYVITCKDAESKVFMKEINKEIKRIEAGRKREMKAGLKEGAREFPHKLMKREGNEFFIDGFHVEDVLMSARNLIGVRTGALFPKTEVEITTVLVEDLEKAIAEQKEK